ncbi:MAG: serine hydrolase [Spirochaetes bacterium]|nr:serine hydrolase [Spirochaetota bacterium]
MKTAATAMLAVTLLVALGCATQQKTSMETKPPPKPPDKSLHEAALLGDMDAVRQHLEAGSDLNRKDAYGSTPLIVAITFGKTDAARALIEGGADIKISNNEGSTPLHLAAFFGRTEIVRSLLDNGADRYLRNRDGATAYDMAAAPFDDDRWLFDRLAKGLKPLGLVFDYAEIEKARAEIAAILRPAPGDLASVDYAPLPGGDWKVSTPEAQGLDPMLVAELYLEASTMENLYGLLVVKNGYLVAEGYFNEGSIEQKARLQSVTKSFTSALVGIALDQGCLSSVDQKMTDFFPELAGQIKDPRKEQITIRHLLQMRAGYPWEETTQELFDILYGGFRPSYLVEIPLASDPGTGFEYSNLTSHLLGIIVSRACDKDLMSYAEEHLFSPMNVEAGEWIQDWEGYYNGHADLHLRARDMAKFGLLYLDGGVYSGKRIISAWWIDESLKNYSKDAWITLDRVNKVGRYFRDLGYGYQWWSAAVGDRRIDFAWGHGGQLIVLLHELDMIIVVTVDPQFGKHGDKAWGQEQAAINLVGKFISFLPKE